MSDGATQSYVDKWLAIQPQQRIALGFVDPAVRDERVALAAFEPVSYTHLTLPTKLL